MIDSLVANWDILVVGAVVMLTVTLGFIVFFEEPKSRTHRQFLYFSLLTAVWGVLNYASYKINEAELAFALLRLTIFSVTWQTLAFLFFTLAFPNQQLAVPRYIRLGLVMLASGVSILTLTPWVFSGIGALSSAGRIIVVVNGPAMPLFGMTTVGFTIAGIFIFFTKMLRAGLKQRNAYRPVAIGLSGMFVLIITSNLLLPVLWKNVDYIPFGALFVFPFIIMTTFAIVRSNLFNVRVISAEGFVLLLLLLNLFQITQSQTATDFIIRGVIVISILAISILLIRSVLREVKQRERMEALSLELAQANERLEELDKLKSEFMGMAGHQLRAPLTVIKGYVSLIMEGTIDGISEKAKEALGKVMFSTDQLVKLVGSLLDLSRIESGKIKYEFAMNDFSQMLAEVMDKFRQNAEKKGIVLALENNLGPARFVFDADKIREAVVNYLDNAIKYSDAGEVRVGLLPMQGPDSAWLRLEVRDLGIGIKKEDIGRLFDKFSRTDEAKQKDPNGMGIGVYFAKRVVQDHGGNVGVYSDGLGKGSTFWMELPMSDFIKNAGRR